MFDVFKKKGKSEKMTLNQFKSSRKWYDNLGIYFRMAAGTPGFTYCNDSLYIEAPEGKNGSYILHIRRNEWKSANLSELEKILYDYWLTA